MATILELAQFARASYGDEIPNSGSWTALPPCRENALEYYGQAYVNDVTKQIVITHRGTRPTSGSDLLNDLKLTAHVATPAQDSAAEYALTIASLDAKYDEYEIINTGHSLGGNNAQAAVAALVSSGRQNVSGVTFNAPGIGGFAYNHNVEYNVLNLSAAGDVIHLAGGEHLGTSAELPAGPSEETYYKLLPLAALGGPASLIIGAYLAYLAVGPAHSINTIVSYLVKDAPEYGQTNWPIEDGVQSSRLYQDKDVGALNYDDGVLSFDVDGFHLSLTSDDDGNIIKTASYDFHDVNENGETESFVKNADNSMNYSVSDAEGQKLLERVINADNSIRVYDYIESKNRVVINEVGADGTLIHTSFDYSDDSEHNSHANGIEVKITRTGYGSAGKYYDADGNIKFEFVINEDGSGHKFSYVDGKLKQENYFDSEGATWGTKNFGASEYRFDASSVGYIVYRYQNRTETINYRADGIVENISYTAATNHTNYYESSWVPPGGLSAGTDGLLYAPNGNVYLNGRLSNLAGLVVFDEDGAISLIAEPDGTGVLPVNPQSRNNSYYNFDGSTHIRSSWQDGTFTWEFVLADDSDDSFAYRDGSAFISHGNGSFSLENRNGSQGYTFVDGLVRTARIEDYTNGELKESIFEQSIVFGSDGELSSYNSFYNDFANDEYHSQEVYSIEANDDGTITRSEWFPDGSKEIYVYSANAFYDRYLISPNGQTKFDSYNPTGRISSIDDGIGNISRLSYSLDGRLLNEYMRDRDGTSRTLVYSQNGNSVETEDGHGNGSKVEYSLSGDVRSESWWDANGNSGSTAFAIDGSYVKLEKTFSGDVITRTYDMYDHLTQEVWESSDMTTVTSFQEDGSSSGTFSRVDGWYGAFDYGSNSAQLTEWFDGEGVLRSRDTVTPEGISTHREWTESGSLLCDTYSTIEGIYGEKWYSENGALSREVYGSGFTGGWERTYDDSGTELSYDWWKKDGSSGSIQYLSDGTVIEVINGFENSHYLKLGTIEGPEMSVIQGSRSDDILNVGDGSNFVAGSNGNDKIILSGGRTVIGFNRGDGIDEITSFNKSANVLSLGAGIDLTHIALSKTDADLVLHLGEDDAIVFKNWYAAGAESIITKLQLVADDYQVEDGLVPMRQYIEYDFSKIVDDFDAERQVDPAIQNWQSAGTFEGALISRDEKTAIGGILTQEYAQSGQVGRNLAAAVEVLSSDVFGFERQSVNVNGQDGPGGDDGGGIILYSLGFNEPNLIELQERIGFDDRLDYENVHEPIVGGRPFVSEPLSNGYDALLQYSNEAFATFTLSELNEISSGKSLEESYANNDLGLDNHGVMIGQMYHGHDLAAQLNLLNLVV